MNPQHKVPTLDDNGFYLCDSHAIATYLIGKYAKNDALYATDLQTRGTIDQRLHFDTGILFPPMAECMVAVIYLGAYEYKAETLANITDAYGLLDMFLDGKPYLVGDSITVADLSCITSVTQLDIVQPIDEKFTNVRAWIERLGQLPYYDELNGSVVAKLKDWITTKLEENRQKSLHKIWIIIDDATSVLFTLNMFICDYFMFSCGMDPQKCTVACVCIVHDSLYTQEKVSW